MSEKRYIVTKNQIFKPIRFALESRIESRSFVECLMDDIENILDFGCFEEYKESEEPCDDCVSRQAVLDVLEREQFKGDAISEIEKLPPDTPQPKTDYKAFAKWVAKEIFDNYWDFNKDSFAELACRKLEKLGIVKSNGDEWELLEQEPCEDVMAIHMQGLDEGIWCAMCTNSMKSDRGCDGGCIVDDEMHKRVMDTINNHILEQEPKTGHWIYTGDEEYINTDGATIYQVMCDKCNTLSYFRKSCGKLVGAEHCPNCGCKMSEYPSCSESEG